MHSSAFRRIGASLLALAIGQTAIAATTPPRYAHVVVVMMENHTYAEIIGNASSPYLTSLSTQGANFTASHGVTHPSQPNYQAIFSGSTQGLTSDNCPNTFTGVNNLGAQLLAAGYTFTGYSEELPSVGFTGCTSNEYARKHAPWTNFPNVPATAGQPFTSFPTASNYASLPTVSFVVPDLMDDMHDGTVAAGDAWVKANIDAYAQWAKTNNSLLIVTFDEDDSVTTANQVPTIFVGQGVIPGNYSENINHYNVLATIEAMYGLPQVLTTATPITDVFGSAVAPTGGTPSANFTVVTSGLTATFTDTSTDTGGTIGAHAWNFGDGTTSTSTNPSHTYAAAGAYVASETVTDSVNATTSSKNATVTVSATNPVTQLLVNPGFESGSTGWTASSGVISASSTTEPSHSGSYDAWLDGYSSAHTDTLSQTVAVPAGKTTATLSYWLHIDTKETSKTSAIDTLKVTAMANGVTTTLASYSNLNAASGYQQYSVNMAQFIGQSVTITFTGVQAGSLTTSFVLDDLALNVQ